MPINETDQEKEVQYKRWQKKRIFVREVSGKYGEIYKKLLDQPRVYSSTDIAWGGGPAKWGKLIMNPQESMVTQLIEIHMNVISPGAGSQKHGHMNSAVMYILEGKGHEIHDGKRYDWKAGDAAIVENACVHQHFADGDKPAKYIIIKGKPVFIFAHLMFQKTVFFPPKEPPAGWEGYQPEN